MDNNFWAVLITSVLAFLGTALGTWGGIRKANELSNYRIEQLEKKVDKHNNLIERTYQLQKQAELLGEKISFANQRLDDLEKKVG